MNVYEKLSHPLALAVFLATLVLPVGVGYLTRRRTRSGSDFFLGGRAVGRIAVALSAVASGRSSWLVLGVSGMAWTLGVSAVWAIVGYTAVEGLQFLYVGRPLRARTGKYGSITLLDYFASRHGDPRHLVRGAGALILAVFLTAYVSAQLHGGAKTLATALEIPLGAALLAGAVLTLTYMVLGGYVAVVWNDVVRAVIMLVCLVLLPVWGLVRIGGFGALVSMLWALDPKFPDPLALGAGAWIGFLGIGLGSPGQPHIVVRYMSIDDPRRLRTAAVVGTFWNAVLGLGAVCIGLLGRAAVPWKEALPGGDPEMIYLVLASDLFDPTLYGLLVGGIFAAILSTVDSQLLVVASTVVRDVYEKILHARTGIDEAAALRLGRRVVLLAGALAVILAWFAQDLVFWLVLFAWGGLGAALGPPLLLSLYWERTTRHGVLAGMLTGTAVTVTWRLWLKDPTGIYELIPAFFLSWLAVVGVSLWFGGRKRRSLRG